METSQEYMSVLRKIEEIKRKLPDLTKSATNPHFKSKYTPLPVIQDALNPLLRENNLMLFDYTSGENYFCTRITDLDTGEWINVRIKMCIEKETAQKFGGATTYYRRYTRVVMFDIKLNEDDDGNTASDNAKKTAPKKELTPEEKDKQIHSEAITLAYKACKINVNKLKTMPKKEQAEVFETVKDYVSSKTGINYDDFRKLKGVALESAICLLREAQ